MNKWESLCLGLCIDDTHSVIKLFAFYNISSQVVEDFNSHISTADFIVILALCRIQTIHGRVPHLCARKCRVLQDVSRQARPKETVAKGV